MQTDWFLSIAHMVRLQSNMAKKFNRLYYVKNWLYYTQITGFVFASCLLKTEHVNMSMDWTHAHGRHIFSGSLQVDWTPICMNGTWQRRGASYIPATLMLTGNHQDEVAQTLGIGENSEPSTRWTILLFWDDFIQVRVSTYVIHAVCWCMIYCTLKPGKWHLVKLPLVENIQLGSKDGSFGHDLSSIWALIGF